MYAPQQQQGGGYHNNNNNNNNNNNKMNHNFNVSASVFIPGGNNPPMTRAPPRNYYGTQQLHYLNYQHGHNHAAGQAPIPGYGYPNSLPAATGPLFPSFTSVIPPGHFPNPGAVPQPPPQQHPAHQQPPAAAANMARHQSQTPPTNVQQAQQPPPPHQQQQQPPPTQQPPPPHNEAGPHGGQPTMMGMNPYANHNQIMQHPQKQQPPTKKASSAIPIINPDTGKKIELFPKKSDEAKSVVEMSSESESNSNKLESTPVPTTTPAATSERIHTEKAVDEKEDSSLSSNAKPNSEIHSDNSSSNKTPTDLKSATELRNNDDGLEPISPTPLPPSPPPSQESSPSALPADSKPKKNNKNKLRKAELNRKGDEKGGSDMDAFKDLASPHESKKEVKESSIVVKTETKTDNASTSNEKQTNEISESSASISSSAVSTPADDDDDDKKEVAAVSPSPDAEEQPKEENHNGENGQSVSSSKNSSLVKLKYNYKDGQWSPLNVAGKKQYDRDFLIQLQKDPMSLTKPENLPSMEIIKNKANDGFKLNLKNPVPDFFPSFSGGGPVIKTTSRGQLAKRPSRDGRRVPQGGRPDGGRGGPPPMIISGLSIQEKVDLHTTENAWKPSKLEGDDATDSSNNVNGETIAVVGKKVRSILNKLTPQKFDVLIVQFEGINIDSTEKLEHCIELVFEKAVDEPGFSVAYAKMCEVLQKKQVMGGSDENNVNFRKLLITKCQKEFEKDYMLGIDKEQYEKKLAAAETEEKKKEIKLEFEFMERGARRRSLGNIQFIGELYKLKMLTARIMHECIGKLLRSQDEESLECLCRLFATVGKDLDLHTNRRFIDSSRSAQIEASKQGMNDFSVYFKRMEDIVKSRSTSSRVRFALQNAIELRENNWVPRRETAGPKTIDQIHKDVEREKTQQQLMNNYSRMDNRDNRTGSRNQMQGGDKRSSRSGQNNNNQAQQQGGDPGWNVVTKASVRSERIDMAKINKSVSSSSKHVDMDNIQLGPGSRGSTFQSWGKGSSSGSRHSQSKPSDDSPMVQKNRFSTLSTGAGDKDEGSERRSSSRGSRGGSADNISDQSRSQYNVKKDAASAAHQDDAGAQEDNLKGTSIPEKDVVYSLTIPIIEEFFNSCDYQEAYVCISEKMHPTTIGFFVSSCFEYSLEKSTKIRNLTGMLLNGLVKKNYLLRSQLKSSVNDTLEIIDDLLIDIPKFWDFFSEMLDPLFEQNTVPLSYILDFVNSPNIERNDRHRQNFLAAILHCLEKNMGKNRLQELWDESKLSFKSIMDQNDVQTFVKEKNLEYLKDCSKKSTDGSIDHETVREKIHRFLSADPKRHEDVCDWIDNTLGQVKARESWFIRILVDECLHNAATMDINKSRKFNRDVLASRTLLLKRYIENDPSRELEALFATQHKVHKLNHPPQMLHEAFDCLLDNDIVTEDSFYAWEKCDDPSESEGKGVAINSTTRFFTWLREAED